jgi:hypothetical protein
MRDDEVETWAVAAQVVRAHAVRCIALGRKNYLFVDSGTGGDRVASIYTIVQTAKLKSVNPETYLCDTLAKIVEFTPWSTLPQT